MDLVDRILRSIRAKWDCRDGVQGILSVSRSFELVPVDSMLGRVDMVYANVEIDLSKMTSGERMKLIQSAMSVKT